ncbi:dihydrofolate reductase family protein [Actinoplanes sp. DH11]|uniref:dihydrofolate reductase family protein n=1 Tax=Actinoplanes sp. DH11 TaxID=2857011 RepID=UPI001E4DB21C|nr:dihydrofolate reductase family protein [Actinoplanes sp. DH11]
MAKLIAMNIVSLDGFVNDEGGKFDWGEPTEEVHRFCNDLDRGIGTHLYGRRMYDVMSFWETAHQEPGLPGHILDYSEIWRAADKIVYSSTLTEPRSARTRIERTFDPEAVRALKESAGRDLAIGGPTLAGEAYRAGLIDEVCLIICPVIVGGGTRALPDGVRRDLTLLDQRTFAKGTVFARYRVNS